jgi:hypothetical protein
MSEEFIGLIPPPKRPKPRPGFHIATSRQSGRFQGCNIRNSRARLADNIVRHAYVAVCELDRLYRWNELVVRPV